MSRSGLEKMAVKIALDLVEAGIPRDVASQRVISLVGTTVAVTNLNRDEDLFETYKMLREVGDNVWPEEEA